MIITHNIASLNTLNKIHSTNNAKSKSFEKLSSGLRINKAADDAAGLAISEKMRGQIRGLNTALRNTQDGISLIQTADGALNEIHSILQRGRELSVQACNGTLTASERKEIGNEINQLTSEVDRISNSTEFNTKKILNFPKSTIDATASNVIKGLKTGWLEASAKKINDVYGLAPKNDFGVILEQGISGGVLADANGSRIRIELVDFAPADGQDGNNSYSSYFAYDDQIVAHELTHTVMMQNVNMSGLPLWFIEGTAEAIAGGDKRLASDLFSSTGLNDIVDEIDDPASSGSKFYSCGYLAVRYMDAAIKVSGGTGIINLMNHLKSDPVNNTLDTALSTSSSGAFASVSDFITKFKNNGVSYLGGTLAGFTSYDIDLANNDVGALGGKDSGVSATEVTQESVIDESTAVDTTDGQPLSAYGINVIWPDIATATEPFTLQIGANCGQTTIVDLPMVNSSELGLDEIDIETKPSDAISIYDKAIGVISSSRSKLGAIQNRLEHTLNNLANSEENLTASESRIRDTDMAKEMTNYTKVKIIEQAASSMLVQANSQPQSVLQLLQA